MIPRLLGRASARLQQPRTLAVVGGASLALALGVAFLPWLFPAGVFRPLSAVLAAPATVLLFGIGAGLLGVQALRESATGATVERAGGPDRWPSRRPPERAYYDEYRTAGNEVDAALDVDPDEVSDADSRRRNARSRIRETAVSVIAADEGIGRDEAARRLSAGSWTDDPRAAAFLGGRRHAPLRTRIRDWASGERFERWATHAVAEIDARERGDIGGDAPERDESGRDSRREVARR